MSDADDRRRYPRLKAPVFFQSSNYFEGKKQSALDVSLGGARIYSDEAVKPGSALELELFLPGGNSVACSVRVAWVVELPKGAAARYEVGLQFTHVPREALDQLDSVLDAEDG